MKKIYVLMFVTLVGLLQLQPARADETVTDYLGNKIVLKEGFVENNGVKIHYYHVGEGPVLIISHGNGDYWFGWRNQIAFLAQRYKVVLYDLRNFNKSDKVVGQAGNIDINYENDLKAVQEKFTDGPAIHMGNDQGGMVMWTYAMRYPEKVKLIIQTNTIHPRAFVRELARNDQQAKASWYIQQYIDDPFKKGLERAILSMDPDRPGRVFPSKEIEKMWRDAFARTTTQGRQGTADWYRFNFPSTPYSPNDYAFGYHGADFPHIKAPTLVIAALNDAALRPSGYNDLGSWIDADFTLLTWMDGDHFQHHNQPARFNDAIGRWLDAYDKGLPKLVK
jgi:pimeloyl-ACP methyl ester carboxylesterase